MAASRSAQAQDSAGVDKQFAHLRADSTIGDLLAHPAFAGFAHRILPWDGRDYDRQVGLSDLSTLLPYHSHVDTASTVAALNLMVNDAGRGRQVFFEIYPDTERRDEPAKAHAGLFFFRGRPGAPFAIVSPGGGFAYVGSVHEGFPMPPQSPRPVSMPSC